MVVEQSPRQKRERVLYTYSTTKLSNTNKVRFYYALKGRDGKSGIIKQTQSTFLAKTLILSAKEHDKEICAFFAHWNIPYTRRLIFILEETRHNAEA